MFLGYKNNKIIVVANTATELERMSKYCNFDWIEATDKEYFEYNGEYVCEVPLDELKQAKRDEINKARDEAEQGGFLYLGKMFDSDPVSCQRILGATLAAQHAPEDFFITWTCQDNSTVDLNSVELIGLSNALASWSNECHQKASKLKALVDKAETKEEVEVISWDSDGDNLSPIKKEEE